MELVRLGVHPGPHHLVPEARVGPLPPQLDQPGRGGLEAAGAAQRQTPFRSGRGHGHLPAPVHLPEHGAVRHQGVLQEDLGEALVAVEAAEAPHRHPLGRQGDQEVGEALVAPGRRVGAEESEQVGAEGAPGGPGLLPGQAPSGAGVVADGHALDGSQVAAGVGLRPPLAPEVLGRGHAGQDAVLLLLGTELEQRGCEQEDPVLRDPLGTPGAVVLLLEDEPLEQGGLTAAVLPGPRHHGPAGVEELALPFPVQGEAGGRVSRGQPAGDVGLQPGPGLGAERLLLLGPGEVQLVAVAPDPLATAR